MKNLYPSQVTIFGEEESLAPKPSGPVAEKFIISPFTILDTRSGVWQERKRAWMAMGIRGEVGRSAKAYNVHSWADEKAGGSKAAGDGTSIFDPVLCELAYRWFCPAGGQVVDPFAGGSVRGIVAAALGRQYWGCDLRPEQIAANEQQAEEIGLNPRPAWICGDSMEKLVDAPLADFIFSCPPYGSLEVYCDDPRDLSNMEHHTFIAAYKRIILKSYQRLKENSFACFVVGDFRDKKGYYRNFVGDTINAFLESGFTLYNEAILATSVGSASMRVTKQFNAGRKMAKTHQNVLVFCKGDWRKAVEKLEKIKE